MKLRAFKSRPGLKTRIFVSAVMHTQKSDLYVKDSLNMTERQLKIMSKRQFQSMSKILLLFKRMLRGIQILK